jgi:lysophospholipase L1-like esterase
VLRLVALLVGGAGVILALVVQARSLLAYNQIAGISQRIAADDARIGVSDYKSASRTVERIVFSRDYVAANGNQYMNPGARVRFKTNSASVVWVYDHTDLNTRSDAFNGVISFLVDGVEQGTATVVYGSAGEASKVISMGSAAMRTWEMIMPYWASVDFLRVQVEPGATVEAAAPRPTKTLLVIGDSITNGSRATKTITSWPYLLGEALGCQVVNMGYGSMAVDAAHVSEAASVEHDAAVYLIGYNNFSAQTALATFKTAYKAALSAYRSAAPGKELFASTMTWTGNTNTLTPANYRTQQSDGLTELADGLITMVDGLTLADNNATVFTDNVHPVDAGMTQMSAALAALIGPL